MSDKVGLLVGVAMLFVPSAAEAQETPPRQTVTGEAAATDQRETQGAAEETEIVVTGIRSTLENAARIKRDSAQVVDSIVAEDIGKLPDTNVAETLQRIPGVQVARNTRGEGNQYTIRGFGVQQILTTVNGRQLFSVTNRAATLLDFSSDILNGLDVYKTATADQLEGGLGGIVNLRTARPLDFNGPRVAGSVSGIYSDMHTSVTPRLSGIASNRWTTAIGEFGLLVGGQWEQVNSGGHQTNANIYSNRQDLYDYDGDGVFPGDSGDIISAPTQIRSRYEQGERIRASFYASAQWRPNPDLTFYMDGFYTFSGGFSNTQSLTVRTAAADGASAAGPFEFKDGTNVPGVATYRNASVQSVTGASENPYRNYHFAVGGKYDAGSLMLSGEFTYTESAGPFRQRDLTLQARAPRATIDLTKNKADASLAGLDATNPAAYSYIGLFDLVQDSLGKEPAFRADLTYSFDDSPLKSVQAGIRYSDHNAIQNTISRSYNASNSGLIRPLAGVSQLTDDNLFHGRDSSLNQWLAIDRDYVKNRGLTRALVGVPLVDLAFDPYSFYDYTEKVYAGYVQANFDFELGLPIDGNLGLRAVKTEGAQQVFQRSPAGPESVTGRSSYTNYLPSVNLRAKFTPNFFLRLAGSKGINRPQYNQLSPALILNPITGGGPATGSGNNPDLQPVEADQYDVSLEYYFGRANYIALAGFRKDITGFVQTFAESETYNGIEYLVTRPRNSPGVGKTQGIEVSYQHFFDFLPGLLNGLGFRGYYTYLDSAIPVLGNSQLLPATGLSKHSYSLTGIYEKGPLSMNASYNWRSEYISQRTSGDPAQRPVNVAPLKSLDFALSYAVNENVSFRLDVVNLLYTAQEQYYGDPLRPNLFNQLDQTVQAGISFRL